MSECLCAPMCVCVMDCVKEQGGREDELLAKVTLLPHSAPTMSREDEQIMICKRSPSHHTTRSSAAGTGSFHPVGDNY